MRLKIDLKDYTGKCINCSFCEAVCPTYQAFDYISSYGARGRIFLAREIVNKKIGIQNVRDFYYSCLNCNVCESVCPAGISAGKASLMVKNIMKNEGIKDYIVDALVKNILKEKSPTGKMVGPSWYDISMKNNSPILFYTGGMYYLMAQAKILSDLIKKNKMKDLAEKILEKNENIIKLFSNFEDKKMKMKMDSIIFKIYNIIKTEYKDVSYLGYLEPYSGALLYEFGYHEELIEYGKYLRDFFNSLNVRNIIVSDPHTYEVLKIVYPEIVDNFNFEIEYYLDIIRLKIKKTNKSYAYHEPCHFTAHLKVDTPLNILNSIGEVKLPVRNGKNTYCCGGPIEMLFPSNSDYISSNRYNQLKELDADEIVTACPVCYANLGKHGDIKDISEILYDLYF
ncbi:MAG: (Fe-S)-binding protein [Thermoplasmata archaeon]